MSDGFVNAATVTLAPNERDVMLLQWRDAKQALDKAKEIEGDLRTKIVTAMFANGKQKGTDTIELGGGWKLKAVKKLNYTLDKDYGKVANARAQLPGYIADRIFEQKFDFSATEYEKLSDIEKAQFVSVINSVITIKPGTPGLELVEPKANGGNG